MRRLGAAFALVALVAGSRSVAAQPVAPGATAEVREPDPSAPFYDAGGATMPLPPPLVRSSPKAVILSPSIVAGEVFVPSLDSGGVLVETMLELGNEIISGGIGYANLGGADGVDFDLSLFRWAGGIRIVQSHGWLGTWLLPDVSLRLACFPGQPAPPSWMLGLETRLGGLRFARCLHNGVCVEISGAAIAGPGMLQITEVQPSVLVGGHLDVGFAFWR